MKVSLDGVMKLVQARFDLELRRKPPKAVPLAPDQNGFFVL